MKSEIRLLLLTVIAITSLSNCSHIETQPTPAIDVTSTLEQRIVPTTTLFSTQTATVVPHIIPTPLPTLTNETAKEALSQFVQANGGCQLPCLFGLTPGVSSLVEARAFLLYFLLNKHPLDLQDNRVGITSRTEKYGGGIRLLFRYEDVSVSVSLGLLTNKEKDVVSQVVFSSGAQKDIGYGLKTLYNDPNYKSILEYYSLTNILNLYGPPSEILIMPFPDYPEHPSPPAQYAFSTVLVYPQKGFLVQYVSIRGQNSSSYLTCPADSRVSVSTWDPKDNFPLSRVVDFFSGSDSINSQNLDSFRKIGEVTSYDIQAFYDRFKSLDSKTCIQTPKKMWQVP